jgi:glycine cleavage system regulatory protein
MAVEGAIMRIVPSTTRPRVKEAIDRFVARVRHNIDVHLETLAGDLVKAIEEEGGQVSADRVSDLARAASTIQTQEGKLDMLAKLVGAMRLQDDASTLRGILGGARARRAPPKAARVAVLLVDGNTLTASRTTGISPAPVPPTPHSTATRRLAP